MFVFHSEHCENEFVGGYNISIKKYEYGLLIVCYASSFILSLIISRSTLFSERKKTVMNTQLPSCTSVF